MGKAKYLRSVAPEGHYTKTPKKPCPHCGKWIKEVGMDDHIRTQHAPPVVVDPK